MTERLRLLIESLVGLAARWLTALADLPRHWRRIGAMLLDLMLGLAATWLALSLRLGVALVAPQPFWVLFGVSMILWFPLATTRGIYRTIIRFAGGRTMIDLAAVGSLYLAAMTVIFLVVGWPGVPRTVGVLQPLIFLTLIASLRLAIRFALVDILHVVRAEGEPSRVMIYGAGRAGQQLALSLRHEPHLKIVGYLDDDHRLDGQRLDGLTVYRSDRLKWARDSLRVNEVLLAMPSASRAQRAAIIDRLQQQAIAVRSLPPMAHIIGGRVSLSDLREVAIEDLLGRDPVEPNPALMGRHIADKVVLVSGAGGSIGSELCRQIIAQRPARLVLVEQNEFGLYAIDDELGQLARRLGLTIQIVPELANVADRDSALRVFRRWRPHTVFHAAAYKHVPLVEANPVAGMRNNIFGTLYATEAAEVAGVDQFILISTDKAVRPPNIMGATKRVCELILQARSAERGKPVYTMVRFGNVLGSSGSVVPRFKQQIATGGPVTLTHSEVTRYFMTIPEAAQLVIQAGSMARGGEVFVLDMGQPVRIRDLAEALIRLSGLSVRDDANPAGDIAITEVGLRPGEKLYEELLIGDNPQPTAHPRIVQAQEDSIGWDRLKAQLESMRGALSAGDAAAALAVLADLVPAFGDAHKRTEAVAGQAAVIPFPHQGRP